MSTIARRDESVRIPPAVRANAARAEALIKGEAPPPPQAQPERLQQVVVVVHDQDRLHDFDPRTRLEGQEAGGEPLGGILVKRAGASTKKVPVSSVL